MNVVVLTAIVILLLGLSEIMELSLGLTNIVSWSEFTDIPGKPGGPTELATIS